MQARCMIKWLSNSPRKQSLSFLSSICVSFSRNSSEKFFIDHPILHFLNISCKYLTDIRTLHAYTITSGLIRDTFAASRIVEFCFKSKSCAHGPQYAQVIFDSLEMPDSYTWNSMIIGLTEHESPESGIAYYYRMLDRGVPPDKYSFSFLVKACIMLVSSSSSSSNSNGSNKIGRKVHCQILKHGVEDLVVVRNSIMNMYCNMGCLVDARLLFDKSPCLDLISWNSMISGYGKCGDVNAARELFEIMPERSLVSWSAMIDGYVRNGKFSEALRLFKEMQALGMKPDVVTLVSVLKVCANLGTLDLGKWVHLYIDKNKLGMEKNVVLSTALVDMYAKCGCIDVALELFTGIHDKDVILWNAMIGGLAMHGHGHDALKFFSRMRRYGTMPNSTTFVTVLCACTHSGMVSEGIEIFNSMKEYNIEPRVEHYGCLADLLGRAGLVCEAEEILSNMPVEPQASQWGALMAACRTHNNIKVGERVGKRLISLEPNDGGRYVLLSNIYASAGRWEDARETRKEMEHKGAKKETGCSFIESDGIFHEFVVGNATHPRSAEIHAMLGELERGLKRVGSEQDTSYIG